MLPLFSLQPVSYSCPLFFIVPLSIANSIQNEVKCEESLDENYSLKPLVKNHETEKSKDANSYEERAIEELKIYNRRNKKKFWTNEEDDLLLKLADETTLTWK